MLRLVVVVLSVGLADSLNPSTVGPALVLTTGTRRVLRVCQFTVGVFAATFAGGLLLTIGPGRLLIGFVPNPQGAVRKAIELIAGMILLICAVAIWLGRRSLARRALPTSSGGASAFVAGASIAGVELPTAVPYFAVIAAIAASSASVPQEIALLLLYNLAFVLPLLTIIAILLLAGHRADRLLDEGGALLQRHWPVVLAGLFLFVGSILVVLGGTGLARN